MTEYDAKSPEVTKVFRRLRLQCCMITKPPHEESKYPKFWFSLISEKSLEIFIKHPVFNKGKKYI